MTDLHSHVEDEAVDERHIVARPSQGSFLRAGQQLVRQVGQERLRLPVLHETTPMLPNGMKRTKQRGDEDSEGKLDQLSLPRHYPGPRPLKCGATSRCISPDGDC